MEALGGNAHENTPSAKTMIDSFESKLCEPCAEDGVVWSTLTELQAYLISRRRPGGLQVQVER